MTIWPGEGIGAGSCYWPLPPKKPLIDFLTNLYWRKWLRLSAIGKYITRPEIWPIWLVRKTVPGHGRYGGRGKQMNKKVSKQTFSHEWDDIELDDIRFLREEFKSINNSLKKVTIGKKNRIKYCCIAVVNNIKRRMEWQSRN